MLSTPFVLAVDQPTIEGQFFVVCGLRSSQGGPFDLTIARGECVSIVGRSGSGKSVLLRLIADPDPGTGQVILEGRDRNDWPAPTWRSRVVYQAAEPAWWCPTVAEHFRPEDRALLENLMQKLDLASTLFKAEVSRLSTGSVNDWRLCVRWRDVPQFSSWMSPQHRWTPIQMLAGMDPVEAVKYQILLLFLLTGESGFASAGAVFLAARSVSDAKHRLRTDHLN
jgi:ABC-type dipeptide/oligopeptide/nickel transport system ATPase component